MRITNKMISDQVVRNLDKSLNRFMRMQAQMSTGKRFQTPSDDPIGAQKDLKYRQILTETAQFRSNIATASNFLSSYDNILGEMNNLIQDAYTTAVAMANDTSSTTARLAAANQVQAIFEQILELGNSQVSGRYIFSGFRTNTQTFESNSQGIRYLGDYGSMQVEVESNTKIGMNLIGSNVLLSQLSTLGSEANLNAGIDPLTLLDDLNLGAGVDYTTGALPGQFVVTDNNLGISVTVDLNLPAPADNTTTMTDVITRIVNQLIAGGITNVAADMGIAGNNLKWATTNTGEVSVNTPLVNLNSGVGIDLNVGVFKIHNADSSIDVDVDISLASTLGDVINTINTSLTGAGVNNVTASINAAGTGLEITDTNGIPLGLTIDSGQVSNDLGIFGDINPTLTGQDLNPKLDFSVKEAATGQTTISDLGLLASFSDDFEGRNLQPILKLTTDLSLLENSFGIELGQIKISQGNREAFLDLNNAAYVTVGDLIDALNNSGLNIVASINPDQTGIQIVNNSTSESLKIEDVGTGRAAHNMGIFGSPDMLGSLMILIDALKNDDGETVGRLIENMEAAESKLLAARGNVGARVNRLEATNRRLVDLDYNFQKLLSEVEDVDLIRLVVDLAQQENNYQAALMAASKIIQPSLMDFLR